MDCAVVFDYFQQKCMTTFNTFSMSCNQNILRNLYNVYHTIYIRGSQPMARGLNMALFKKKYGPFNVRENIGYFIKF